MTVEQRQTKAAKQLYCKASGLFWPPGWKIIWNVAGMTIPQKRVIYLSFDKLRDNFDLETLIHEFVHMEHPRWKHGKYFDKRVKELLKGAKKEAKK